MFHKFSLTPSKPRRHNETSGHTPSESGNELPTSAAASQSATKKRRKISRACDRCRLQRIKCDEQKPCARCIAHEVECTVSHAFQGNASIHNVDAGLAGGELSISTLSDINPISSMVSPLTIAAMTLDLPIPFNLPYKPCDLASDVRRFLATGLTAGAGTQDGALFPQIPHPALPSVELPFLSEPLTRDERRKHLRIFWESCHPLLHIMSDMHFVELEATAQATVLETYSVENALLDAILALAIQHGRGTGFGKRLSSRPRPESAAKEREIVDWPGFEQFHRCRERMRINTEMTLQALQCHALMVIYLMRSHAFRDAYNMLGITVRKAYVAELQRSPPSHLPEKERTSRMQLWWLIFSLDLQCSVQLNMPAACQKALAKCPVPTADALSRHLPMRAGHGDDLAACDYSTLLIRLAIVVTDIGACVSTADLLDDGSDDPAVLENHASRLVHPLQALEDWHSQLPGALLLGTAAFEDPDSFELSEDLTLPAWVQRQKALLELQYHNAYVLILWPFVNLGFAHFTEHSVRTPTVTSEYEHSHVQRHIAQAVRHASAIVDIAFALSSTSDVLYGWPEVVQLLWNATMVLITFVYVNSLNPGSLSAEQRLADAGAVFECFGATSAAAKSAKEVVQRLVRSLKESQTFAT